MNKSIKNTIYYSIGEILPKTVQFFLLPLYTKFLSTSDYGIVSYTNTVVTFLNVFTLLSLNSYVLRYYFIYKDEKKRKEVIGTIYLTIAITNLLLLGLSFLFVPSIISRFNIQIAWNPFFKLALLSNFFHSFATIPLVLYRVKEQANRFVFLSVGRTFLTIALNIILIVYFHKGINGYFNAMLWGNMAFLPLYLLILSKNSIFCLKKDIIKEAFKFSLPLVPGTISFLILSMSDRVILERFVSLSDMGIYNVACTISLAMSIIVHSGYRAIEPTVYSKHVQRGYYEFVKKTQSYYMFAIFCGGLCLSLFSQEIFYFFTSESFHGGYIYMPLLVVTSYMTGLNIIYTMVLTGDKKTGTIGVTTLIGGLLSIGLNITFIPMFGVFAAACSSAFSFIIMNLILYFKMDFPQKVLVRELVSCIICVGLPYIIFKVFPTFCILGFLIKMLAVVFVFIILFRMYDIKRSDLAQFKISRK